jgi:hypothetical protein
MDCIDRRVVERDLGDVRIDSDPAPLILVLIVEDEVAPVGVSTSLAGRDLLPLQEDRRLGALLQEALLALLVDELQLLLDLQRTAGLRRIRRRSAGDGARRSDRGCCGRTLDRRAAGEPVRARIRHQKPPVPVYSPSPPTIV